MKLRTISILTILLISLCGACEDAPSPVTPIDKPVTDSFGFARGADVSWLTEQEKAGSKFYSAQGTEMECMELLRDLGMNSIRLRVWVNPAYGWCNKSDLLVKAWRARKLGMRIMVDFHYSDFWADPGKQNKPAAWINLPFEQLKAAVADHTKEVLNALKSNNITPEWVQVGNETGNGMLWEDGKASVNMAQYAQLNNAGYDAVKEIFPQAKVIVHVQEGNKNSLFRWLFDGLKNNGGKWDVIGMSLYPTDTTWQQMTTATIENMKDMISRYGTPVMMCEVGMPWEETQASKDFLTEIITKSESIANNKCLGVFYWEPQSYNNWKGYTLGAFDNSGKPTIALDAFKRQN